MPDFCTDRNSAEVATDVILLVRDFPAQDEPCLVVVPQGVAVVSRERQYRPQLLCYRPGLAPVVATVVPRLAAVVP